jgi:hypothetical protein
MADKIRVNGNQMSWGSLIFKVAGERYTGFTSVDFGDKLEVVLAYGMGKHQAPRARSRGKYVPDPLKVKGPSTTVQALRQKLADLSQSGTSYGTIEFNGTLQYSEADEDPLTVEFERCRFVANRAAHEEGAEVLQDEVEISVMKIRRNGLVLFDDSQGSP